jgi:hypothetical protein
MALWYRFEISAWNIGTDDLTLEQEAAYLRIVNATHLHQEAIKDNMRVLGGLWRCHERRAKRLRQELIDAGKLVSAGGRLFNPRALEEAKSFKEYTEQQAEYGRMGGKAKGKGKVQDDLPGMDAEEAKPEPAPEQKPEPAPETEPEKSTDSAGQCPASEAPPEELEPRERVLVAMGHDPSGLTAGGKLVGTQADMMQYARWRDELGLSMEDIEGVIGEVCRGKRDGPPTSFRYFTAAMQRFAEEKAEAAKPLPKVQRKEDRSRDVSEALGGVVKRFPGVQKPSERKKA